MKFTAQQIATLVGGRIEGDANTKVKSFAKIEESNEGDLCFLANAKYEEYLYDSKASVVIVNESMVLKNAVQSTLIRVADAYAAFAILLQTYQEITASKPKSGIEAMSFKALSAVIDENVYLGAFSYVADGVKIGKGSQIYPNAYIGENVSIGENTIIYAGVKIYKDCVIGSHCILHAGTVIGSDGFGFAPENGSFKKIPQIGNVVIEDHVEIGANCTIDRATMGSTRIKKGVKLDNLIQIAHNVEIGESTVIASQAGISGSTKLGKYCMIGGQAGIVGHIQIANGTKINAQSGVAKEVTKENSSLTGSPAFDYRTSLKSQVVYRNLPDMLKRIDELEKRIGELQNKEIV
ncbi:MAG TPA: UDP-3-O-(3-hydroxymyristoyl)glucosamine N-acyltransferase [Chitinophagaceae bacterium]|nr:UDP-3-O-(3-hydroxymyristoyl)glucosamine N-acyltransferase [Chitinophagaceae bacterium]